MTPITTKIQLDQLMNETMIYAIIVVIVAIFVSFIVANLFPWQGGNDRSYIKRRISYIIIGILAVFGFWLFNDTVILSNIRGAGLQNMFQSCNTKCLIITAVGYVVIGLILMFSFRLSKFGSILGKMKN